MGVVGLWKLLRPCSKSLSIESLAKQRLAIDVSIWLTQFVNAMRDDQGNLVDNAHIIGMFKRLACQLDLKLFLL